MNQSATKKTSKMVIVLNKIKTYFSKPQNIILLLFGIVLTFTTVAPIVAIVEDTFKIHPGTIDAHPNYDRLYILPVGSHLKGPTLHSDSSVFHLPDQQ